MRLYFLRHAQSTNNELSDRTGAEIGRSEDPSLTENGHKQAELLGAHLASAPSHDAPVGMDSKDLLGFGITHVYCSLMERAVLTGTYVSRALGLPLSGWADIHESGGIYLDDGPDGSPIGRPGRSASELRARFPQLLLPENVGDRGWWNRPFEPKADRPVRARRVLDELLRRHGGTEDRIAIVSHGGFFNWLMGQIVGISRADSVWLHTNNASISRVDFHPEISVVQYINRTDHLPPELIT
ncbi:MAG TPA: histidine phosphatase family protein [Spirochaetia bacterium]|nr:histidine phosphatase family protein [Spirochaetia bacterium]